MTGFCGLGKMFRQMPTNHPKLGLSDGGKFLGSTKHTTALCCQRDSMVNAFSNPWAACGKAPATIQTYNTKVWFGAGNQRDSRHKSWKYVGSSWKIEATGSLDHCQLLDSHKIWIDSKFEGNFCQETTAKLDHITGLSGSYSKPRSWRNNCENDKKNSQVLQKWSI